MSLTQKDLQLESFLINGEKLLAQVIYTSITCRTWAMLPRKIDIIAEKVTELYKCEFKRIINDYYLKEFATYGELRRWLKEHLLVIPEIEELNLSQAEFNAGIGVEDESREKFVFSSAYSQACAVEDDFIDLDAYIDNVCQGLIGSCVDIDFSTFK